MDEIVIIELFGEEFRFKPDDKVENAQQVATHLKKYITEAEQLFADKATGRDKIAILLLAAMNLSKDFHELKVMHSKLETQMSTKISSLLKKIEKELE